MFELLVFENFYLRTRKRNRLFKLLKYHITLIIGAYKGF